ncbi:MAG: hydrogenase expression/formation protein HypE [Dehalococcoidales bacterium]|nr:hydrogenase expression/formation protein HypE [Dehalococcoidales bacterium]
MEKNKSMEANDKILLAHGSGGKLAHDLITKNFVTALDNEILSRMDDAAVFEAKGRLAFTTDSYVVNPIFFPGGDIGRLAVCGTVNDLSTSGAKALYLSLAFIIEEGFAVKDLQKIVASIKATATEAGVKIITGDTKVVNRGGADKIFINTAGLGAIADGVEISGINAKPGDKVIITGTIGDHGIAVLSQREGLGFETKLKSDVAPLGNMVAEMLKVSGKIHVLRDPTRGGLASTLNEIAKQAQVSIRLDESKIPIREEVNGACEMLGLDPLYVANEGKMIVIVSPEDADKVLKAIQKNVYGKNAAVIGDVASDHAGRVSLKTALGSSRIVDMLVGEPLPRIC